MVDIPGLIAGLAICPDAVTPAADKQCFNTPSVTLLESPMPIASRETTHYGWHSLKWAYEVSLVI